MTEQNNSGSHWNDLASTLGATPSTEVERNQSERQPASPPALPKKPEPIRQRSAPTKKPGWDSLASEFGLPADPAPQKPTVKPTPATPPPSVKKTPLADKPSPENLNLPPSSQTAAPAAAPTAAPELPIPIAPVRETAEDSPNFFDERFDFEEPFDLLEAGDSKPADAETSDESPEATEKRRRRRRRRRRSKSPDQPAVSNELHENENEPSTSNTETPTDADETERAARDPGEEDPEAQRRPKRRRSRRGRGRRDPNAPAASESETRQATPKNDIHDEDAIDADLHDVHAEIDDDEASDEEQPARLGFRGIPSWDDVVGVLVTKNIEARAKRPAAGQQHHGRGQRGGGRAPGGGKRR